MRPTGFTIRVVDDCVTSSPERAVGLLVSEVAGSGEIRVDLIARLPGGRGDVVPFVPSHNSTDSIPYADVR
jgi:hypothetical protein